MEFIDAYLLFNIFNGENPELKQELHFYPFDIGPVDIYDNCSNVIGYVSNVPNIPNIWDSKIDKAIHQFRKDNLIPVATKGMCYVSPDYLEEKGITSGVLVAVQDNIGVIYLGAIEIEAEEEDEDEDRYELTEEGQRYFEDYEYPYTESITESILDNLINESGHIYPEERKEGKIMDNLFENLGFGKLRDYRFKLSVNGIAVKQPNGKYVVYNKENNEFVDVTNTLLDIKDALFLLPAVDVEAGDTVLHEGKAYYIVSVGNEIKAVSYEDCTQTVLIPKSTMFGIKYFQKVFSMFGDNFAANGDLFSNPMMLMALMDGGSNDLTQLMLLNSLNKGELGNNPMALAMLLKGDKGNDNLSAIALMSIFNNGASPFTPKKNKTTKED